MEPPQVGPFILAPVSNGKALLFRDGLPVGEVVTSTKNAVIQMVRFEPDWTENLARMSSQIFDWTQEAWTGKYRPVTLRVSLPETPGYGEYLIDQLLTTRTLPWLRAGFIPDPSTNQLAISKFPGVLE